MYIIEMNMTHMCRVRGGIINQKMKVIRGGGEKMSFDFKKEYKEFYMPKNKPEIVTVPKRNF